MRISDWSSDVCSSDLRNVGAHADSGTGAAADPAGEVLRRQAHVRRTRVGGAAPARRLLRGLGHRADRKSVVSGKSVSVRVDLGGRRLFKTKQTTESYAR